MKLAMTAVLGGFLAASLTAAEPTDLKDPKDRVSYSIGMDIGNNLKRQSIEVNPDMLTKGLKDVLTGQKPELSQEEAHAAIMNLQKEMMAQRNAEAAKSGEANAKEGEAFLAANKNREGVHTLPDGLQYKILEEGTGPTPNSNDVVQVRYKGTLINGTEFDSSYKRGTAPAEFQVDRVIHGWTEALTKMKVGSKWMLFIPPDLAYGQRGAGRDIGPNETLIFEVELVGIKSKPETPAAK